MWWDSNGRAPGSQQAGCWRMVEGGKRYLTATWPPGDVMAQRTPNDPCNNYGAGFLIDPKPAKTRMIENHATLVRRLAGFATSGVLFGVLALSPAMPVSALDQSAHARSGSPRTRRWRRSSARCPGQPAPRLCRRRPPSSTRPRPCKQQTYCDVIPLEVVLPPTLKKSDEFFVSVSLEWKTERIEASRPAATIHQADRRQRHGPLRVGRPGRREGPDPASRRPPQNPETLRLFRPSKGKYSIVVFNYVGPNTGYKLTVEYKPETIVPPFESLAPEFTAGRDAADAVRAAGRGPRSRWAADRHLRCRGRHRR